MKQPCQEGRVYLDCFREAYIWAEPPGRAGLFRLFYGGIYLGGTRPYNLIDYGLK
jgi:hypothetical protein